MPLTIQIQSTKNLAVLAARRLHQSRERRSQERLLLEGTHLIEEALLARFQIESLFATTTWYSKNSELTTKLNRTNQSITLYEVSEPVIKAVATTEQPDGVVGIAKHRPAESQTIASKLKLGIAVENMQSPGNLGTLIRSVEAAGGDGLWLSPDSVDPTNPKVLRAAAGQWFRNPPITVDLPSWIRQMKLANVQVLGASMDGESYWKVDLKRPTVFVIGNEGNGLTESIVKAVDKTISIPMASGVESLNAAMTGCLLLYEARRQRSMK